MSTLSNLKKFEITCNEGSLGGEGHSQADMIVIIWAVDEQHARKIFMNDKANQVYGRRIKKVRQV
jgi:hypothetical protein